MTKIPVSVKHIQIDKANATILSIMVIASFVTVFCLIFSKSLLSQAAYQNKVVAARKASLKHVKSYKTAADTLVNQYTQVFENSGSSNVIGGRNDTSEKAVPPDGDNARIVLDSLPTTYDFPALISSISKLLGTNGISSQNITGSDQSTTVKVVPSPTPQSAQIAVSVSGSSTYANIQKFVTDLERSTRPFDITSLQLNGSAASMTASLNMNTYYQPAKSVTVEQKPVK